MMPLAKVRADKKDSGGVRQLDKSITFGPNDGNSNVVPSGYDGVMGSPNGTPGSTPTNANNSKSKERMM